MEPVKLNVPGLHNVSNALGAIASCHVLGCDFSSIKAGLLNFSGTQKRFQTKGSVDGIKVIDDYAHHPSEVKATLSAAKNARYKKIWCVFQPHTYTRTKAFLNDFAQAFADADQVIISDIYAAREADKGEIHAKVLADKISESGKPCVYINGFDAIADYLDKNVSSEELIITMGAGDISKVGETFLKKRKGDLCQ